VQVETITQTGSYTIVSRRRKDADDDDDDDDDEDRALYLELV
jgi:hypothetical protein